MKTSLRFVLICCLLLAFVCALVLKVVTDRWFILESIVGPPVVWTVSYLFARHVHPWMLKSINRFVTGSILLLSPLLILFVYVCVAMALSLEKAVLLGLLIVVFPSALTLFSVIIHHRRFKETSKDL